METLSREILSWCSESRNRKIESEQIILMRQQAWGHMFWQKSRFFFHRLTVLSNWILLFNISSLMFYFVTQPLNDDRNKYLQFSISYRPIKSTNQPCWNNRYMGPDYNLKMLKAQLIIIFFKHHAVYTHFDITIHFVVNKHTHMFFSGTAHATVTSIQKNYFAKNTLFLWLAQTKLFP